MLTDDDLFTAQRRAIERLATMPGAFKLSDIGTGKTIVVLKGLMRSKLPWERALVIAPPDVARSTWPDEVRAWEGVRDFYRVGVATGTAKQRRRVLLDPSYNLVTMTCHTVPQFFELFKPGEVPFDVLVIDESDKFKDPGTARFKAIRRRGLEFPRRICMTGTPAGEHLINVWSQAHIVSPGVLGSSYSKFKATYFYPVNMHAQWSKLAPHAWAEEDIYKKIEPFTIRIDRKDLFDMPKRMVQTVKIEMPAKLRTMYKEIEKQFLVEVGEQNLIPIGSAGALHQKLKQVVDGFVYDEQKITHELHSVKLDAARDLIQQITDGGNQVLVVYRYRHTVDNLQIPYLGGGVTPKERKGLIERWNKGAVPVMGIHPASAGHGLNLQLGGCHHILIFGAPDSRPLYDQVTGRIDRTGQENQVIEHRLLMNDTIDADIYTGLQKKGDTQTAFLDAMRARCGVMR